MSQSRRQIERVLRGRAPQRIRRAYRGLRVRRSRLSAAPTFECPLCGFTGPFLPSARPFRRAFAMCPNCSAAERHRLVAAAAATRLSAAYDTVVHFAAEPALAEFFEARARHYVTADIAPGRDARLDLTALGLRSASVDLVVAIHVFEHVPDDHRALEEVARVLAPGGVAVIAVPVVADLTVEYTRPNPNEHLHVRAPGVDWYKRLDAHFRSVELVSSSDVATEFQTLIFEDRTVFPSERFPERPTQRGSYHHDYVAFAHR